jgi:hypothetical protein
MRGIASEIAIAAKTSAISSFVCRSMSYFSNSQTVAFGARNIKGWLLYNFHK